jgi:pilus assembly protein CpaF
MAIRAGTRAAGMYAGVPAAIDAILVRMVNGVDKERVQLLSEMTLGRVQGNDIVLGHGSLSKRHARIVFTHNQFMLVDLGSTNGTYLNGRRVQAAAALTDGDKIVLGDFEYRFQLGKV